MSWIRDLDHFRIPNDIVIQLAKTYMHLGKQVYHDDIIKGEILNYIDQTLEKDIINFAKLIELDIPQNRLIALIRKDIVPRNNTEKTVVNFKQVQRNVMTKYSTFEFSINEVESIHKLVFKNIANVSYAKEEVRTKFHSQRKVSKKNDLDDIFRESEALFKGNKYEKLLLSTLLYIDFYNIKGFVEMNEYTSLIILQLLLLKSGFDNLKYISLYEYINEHIEEYKKALAAATFSYEEGLSQPLPIIRFFLNMLLETGDEIEHMVRNHEYDKSLNKSYSLENTIFKLPDIFTKEDLRRAHPQISDSTINRTLVRLKDQGVVRPIGKGRSAKWMRIKTLEKFDMEQMSFELPGEE